MNKCHNCDNRLADGGFKKRIKREFADLEKKRNTELNQVKGDNQREINQKKMIINEKYDSIVKTKSNETPKRVGRCLYCGGFGTKHG